MSGNALPLAAWRAAHRRDAAILAAFALPWLAAIGMQVTRLTNLRLACLAIAALIAVAIAALRLRRRRRDARWLVRTLDAQRPDMEDSADLLLANTAHTDLQRLQRQRLQQRLAANPPDLRAAWPWPALAASLFFASLLLAGGMLWPRQQIARSPVAAAPVRFAGSPLRLVAHAITVTPPRHTGLPARSETTLSLKAPQHALLRWHLRFSSQPKQVMLVFGDDRRLALTASGNTWSATWPLAASTLYRIEADGRLQTDTPHRLQALPDQPPQVKVLLPAHTLTSATPRQRDWELRFAASDDYGIAAGALLRITIASGSGENIAFRQRDIALTGSGSATSRQFTHRLDLAALGLAPGDDVLAQLHVRDNHPPQPQQARSPSLILRLPAARAQQASDLEASIRKVMPAYFRSQRQIIIDAEALLKQRRLLDAETFTRRADAIGVDQRILRLRYGQFLGEEAEGGVKPLPTGDQPVAEAAAGDDDHAHAESHDSKTAANPGLDDLLAEYGHTHDHAEAATLLDPQTRATLKLALDQMWQSEGALRQGKPDAALPFAYQALGFIKQVQQAQRIYLARVGPDLPPIDESRRMGGKRDGLASRTLPLAPASHADAALVSSWRALADAPDAPTDVALPALQAWLRQHPQRIADPLALQAAIDSVQRKPDCRACRAALRAMLWPLLATPPAAVPRRAAIDAQGRRYLDALDAEAQR